MMKKPMTIPWW